MSALNVTVGRLHRIGIGIRTPLAGSVQTFPVGGCSAD